MIKNNKPVKTFHPFTHENLDIKNELLNLARKARASGEERKLENDLASILLYSSIAEYLAENLFENLTYFVKTSTYNNFAGILFVEKISNKDNHMTLGEMMREIDKFSFPDKKEIMKCFDAVCTARNRIFHDLAKSDINSITEMLSKDLPLIQEKCEELIAKINTIYLGLGKVLLPPQPNVQT